jgi:hypothetical protein
MDNDTTAHVLELLDKIAGPLPQRIVNVDTGEKSDEYRISVSAAERDLIVTALRGNAALEAALSARTSELYPDLQAEIERLRAYRALPPVTPKSLHWLGDREDADATRHALDMTGCVAYFDRQSDCLAFMRWLTNVDQPTLTEPRRQP